VDRKNVIIKIATKLKKKYEGKNPTEILAMLKNNNGIKPLLETLTAKESVILIFLLSSNKIKDLSVLYDVLISTMYFYKMVYLIEKDPDTECDYCGGDGYNTCDDCGSTGQISCDNCDGDGEVDCEYCDDGEYGGETCDECQGGGKVTCEDCLGDSVMKCPNCDGDGDIKCYRCYEGMVTKHDSIRYESKDVITYNPHIKGIMDSSDSSEFIKLNKDIYDKTENSEFDLVLKIGEYITEEFNVFNEDDSLLVQVINNDDLSLVQHISTGSFIIRETQSEEFY